MERIFYWHINLLFNNENFTGIIITINENIQALVNINENIQDLVNINDMSNIFKYISEVDKNNISSFADIKYYNSFYSSLHLSNKLIRN
jgi:hypothetical protein